jgi:enoyl-CoA hydratase/carnithine racemase
LTLGDDGILVATMDLPGRPMNVVGDELMGGIAAAMEKLADPAVKGLILTSGKADFCAGGDLDRMSKWTSAEEPFEGSMAMKKRAARSWKRRASRWWPRSTATRWAAGWNWRWAATRAS